MEPLILLLTNTSPLSPLLLPLKNGLTCLTSVHTVFGSSLSVINYSNSLGDRGESEKARIQITSNIPKDSFSLSSIPSLPTPNVLPRLLHSVTRFSQCSGRGGHWGLQISILLAHCNYSRKKNLSQPVSISQCRQELWCLEHVSSPESVAVARDTGNWLANLCHV